MQRSSRALAALGLAACLLAGGAGAQQDGARQRFSIAISGGASKGAYEAGLNWAILKILRETERLESLTGGRMRPFDAASAAGASAGAVNTILSGMSWCARAEDEGGVANNIGENLFRETWLRIDINELLPPEADSPIYLPDDAVLSRRDYFAAAESLRTKWHEPAYRRGCRVPMGVTVTRIVPRALQVGDLEVRNQRFVIPFELRVNADGTVGFFFDPATYPELSDPSMILLPRRRGDNELTVPDEGVIGAAVASSSFPVAFGRRRLQYCSLDVRGSGNAPEGKSSADSDTENDLVCPSGYSLEEAEFADGGLFDNLPIGLARVLAEESASAKVDPLPVTYIYLDPNRIRYEPPEVAKKTACTSANPPAACRLMEFGFFSESRLLLGALGTARSYELYRETTSDYWRLNLSQLGYELASLLSEQRPDLDCEAALPFFDSGLTCAESIRASARLLEFAYDRTQPQLAPPYSAQRLMEAGDATRCEPVAGGTGGLRGIACTFDIRRLRNRLARAFLDITRQSGVDDERLHVSISRSQQSIHDDRVLRVSSRGAPITGTLLGDFGSFLEYKFREYDYYVGVYDAIVVASQNQCALRYSRERQRTEYRQCVDELGRQLYAAVEVDKDARARYVFARLAEREFSSQKQLAFAYTPQPPVDRDMAIIHDGLEKALEAGETDTGEERSLFVIEDTFFEYLNAEGFVPTATGDSSTPLLAEIMTDPKSWATELTRRITARLVYLERQAADIFAAREADPEKRQSAHTVFMGATAYLLQSSTYEYPTFTLSPSTAPEDWFWRNVIPYEVAVDTVEGDLLVTWQPTWEFSGHNLVDARLTLGFAGGLVRSSADKERENYLGLGLGYIRRTDSPIFSSFGITPTWYHTWKSPETGDQDTAGGEVHLGLLKDRIRLGVGTRDVEDFGDDWFLTIGIADVPGAIYWLTR